MTNTVTVLTHSVDKSHIVRLFAQFTSRYQHAWTSLASSDEDWEFIIDDWLSELSQFTIGCLYKAVRDAFSIYKNFAPKLGELVDLCMKASGIPDVSDVICMMVEKRFDHPIAKIVYDKIGSWKISNGSEKEIRDLASIAYQRATIDFMENPKPQWEKLNAYLDKPKALEAPPKIPSTKESAAFKECMSKCQEVLKGAGIKAKTYKQFEEEAISPSNNSFDQKVYEEFREYLMSIPETETMILPPTYALRRSKFLAEREQADYLRKAGYNPNQVVHNTEPPRRHNGPTRVYQAYPGD